MSPVKTPLYEIRMQCPAQELVGWLTEDEARDVIKRGRATVLNHGRRTRCIQLIADPDAPLRGSARAAAVAGYLGKALQSTYVEPLPDAGTKVVSMMRFNPRTGQLVRWPST